MAIETRARHRRRLLQTEESKHRRGEIGERTAVTKTSAGEREDERHRVRRVGGVRADAVGFEHLLGVAVVGGDEADAPERVGRLDDAPERRVGCLNGADDGRDHSGMPDHVGVCEIDDAEAVSVGERCSDLLGDDRRGHLGSEVVARHVAGRRNENPLFAIPRGLVAAVEEIGHVCVLLGLGSVELAQTGRAQHLGERGGDVLFLERDRRDDVLGVSRHRRQVDARVPEARERAGAHGPGGS